MPRQQPAAFGLPGGGGSRQQGGAGAKARLAIAVVIALVAIIGYMSKSSVNPVTGQTQRIAMSFEQEIALGLQAAPEMMRQHGGEARDARAQALVDQVGHRLLQALPDDMPWQFDFHLLADPQVINAFALPGGQVFITDALFSRLETEGQLAGVLGHEIGHVIERHGAQRLAKQNLMQGLVGAVAVGTYDPERGGAQAAVLAQAIGTLVTLKYGRNDELQSDQWGVSLTAKAGYDPRAMIRVMEILREASGGSRQPEFMSSHPDPGNRIDRIEAAIREVFPNGVPEGLEP
ncbi:MAG: M48 family metalloprotease [Phycisphaerales bacterium]|nr:M48 family metalloprotease [Phycisphaerales bacterium]